MIKPIKKITGKGLPLPGNDIDTDRIIPARFLRCVTFDGLGENAFYDERFLNGQTLNHPMNNQVYKNAKIILTGANFGCGSSREHAPQAIKRAGFEAIVAESFAEIFFGNSSVLGLVCVCLSKEDINQIMKVVEAYPDTNIEINIETKTLKCGNISYSIKINENLHKSLMEGSYDVLAELISNKDKVTKFNKEMPPRF